MMKKIVSILAAGSVLALASCDGPGVEVISQEEYEVLEDQLLELQEENEVIREEFEALSNDYTLFRDTVGTELGLETELE